MDNKNIASSSKIHRILIVDDHPLIRVGLSSLIEAEADLKVCGETGKISEALDLVRISDPDVAIVDLSLADGNGLELVKRLAAQHKDLRILVCIQARKALRRARPRRRRQQLTRTPQRTDRPLRILHFPT